MVHNLYQMLNKKLKLVQTLPYFTKNTLRTISSDLDNTLDVSIRRMLGRGQLIKLKNGFYTTEYYFNKNGHKPEYREFISSVLSQPSYLSLEYVLGEYDILTEETQAFTAITLKSSRSYENKLGSFLYKNIPESFFVGFEARIFAHNTYLIASKAKALFDYLYSLSSVLDLSVDGYDVVEERRLKIELLNHNDWDEFSTYLRIKKGKKASLIKEKLKKYAPNL